MEHNNCVINVNIYSVHKHTSIILYRYLTEISVFIKNNIETGTKNILDLATIPQLKKKNH